MAADLNSPAKLHQFLENERETGTRTRGGGGAGGSGSVPGALGQVHRTPSEDDLVPLRDFAAEENASRRYLFHIEYAVPVQLLLRPQSNVQAHREAYLPHLRDDGLARENRLGEARADATEALRVPLGEVLKYRLTREAERAEPRTQ
jgi:hypothetical protein